MSFLHQTKDLKELRATKFSHDSQRYFSNYTNRLVFVMEGRCAFCEVGIDLLSIAEISFVISMILHICYIGAAEILSNGVSPKICLRTHVSAV
jgi:hypothetical protein